MFRYLESGSRAGLIWGAAAAVVMATPATAQTGKLVIQSQPMASALREVASKTGIDVLFTPESVRNLRSAPVNGASTAREAVQQIIARTGLEVVSGPNGALVVRNKIVSAADPDASAGLADEADIIVTANKREQRLRDVPSAIGVVTATDLRRTQAQRLEDYATKIPGLNFVSTGEGTTQLILRGVTAGTSQLSSTVAIYIDDTPYNSSTVFAGAATGVPDLDPSDIDHIEVLKGPQGTLYGADALGGVLKFVTVKPDSREFSGRVAGGASFVDGGGSGHTLSAALNIPLVADRLAVRVSGFDRRDPGYIDDPSRGVTDINDSKVYGGRVALLWQPVDRLTVNLSALLQNLDAANPAAEDVSAPRLSPLTGDREQTRFFDSPKKYKYRVYNGNIAYDLGGASLVSSTSYATFDLRRTDDVPALDYQVAPLGLVARVFQPVSNNKFSQEIRLQSVGERPLEWRVGGFFTRENSVQTQHIDLLTNPGLQPVAAYADVVVRDRYSEYAVFGDLTYHFTSRFDVTVGGRYSHNRQHFVEKGVLPNGAIDADTRTSDDSATWLVNPRFRIDDQTMVYLRAASAYRPGGPTTVVPGFTGPRSFKPDSLINYEAGLKGSYFDHRLTIDVAAFYIDWKDIQLNETINGDTYITNGGKASSKGVEASAALTPFRGLSLAATATYTDAKLTEDAPGAGGRKGDRLPGTPHWNASFDASYDWSLGADWGAFVGGSYRHVGNRLSDFLLDPALGFGPATRYPLGAYDVGDLRAGLTHKGWTLTAFVKNVGDERGVLAIAPLTPFPSLSPYSAAIIQPRTFGIDLSASF
jgi:outer membrane receptor protein involved in Fe transport